MLSKKKNAQISKQISDTCLFCKQIGNEARDEHEESLISAL